MKRLLVIYLVTFLAFFSMAAYLSAAVPHLIRFQGKVTDREGAPLNGSYNITFRIYDADTGGALEWDETQTSIPVNNGIFTVLLGQVTPLNLAFDEPYWLSMEVNQDGEMAPRQRISSVGYAYRAETADSISGVELVPQGAIILWRGSEGCPDGYSRVTALDNKFLVGGSSYNSAAGGSNTHSHAAGSYKGPSHTHSVNGNTDWAAQDEYGLGDDFVQGATHHTHTISITSGANGTGSVTGTSAEADNRPEFATVILCEKD
ncbi:hypothetical protein ACFL2I_01775 [Candidatus Omnitrophota bacterium]